MRTKTRTPLLFTLLLLAAHSLSAHADVVDYFANADANRRLEFGDGRDGAFVNGPSQAGITVVGATITIDTSVKNIFQFTSFTLSAGFTLNASGTEPLVIRVQGPATIAGAVHLDGAAGGPAVAAAPGAGGAAGAGGGNGGLGGKEPPSSVDGANAAPRTGSSIGGGGGPNGVAAPGAQKEGGGGCLGPGATGGLNYPAGAATCPYSFVDVADRFEVSYFLPAAGSVPGGGGGGGGATRNQDATNVMNGAGGGGAGGALVLTASADVTLTGTITASGGSGGAGDVGNTDYGASGGGGSGGALWIQSASRVSGAGTLTVAPGAGGQDAFAASIGGTGSRGVVRIDATTPAFTGTVSPGGAVDRTYTVFPVTVEFGISAGPACGSVSRPGHGFENGRDFFLNALVWCALFALVNFALNGRSARSSRSGSKS